ncbi:hypothetical protein BaRGS_00004720, partial [Batillaria attramentaria]
MAGIEVSLRRQELMAGMADSQICPRSETGLVEGPQIFPAHARAPHETTQLVAAPDRTSW